jgi:tripeptidyl-peptidase-1
MTNNTYFAWTTGGGFSDVTPMPAYQKNEVQAYLAKPNVMKPPTRYFNPNNRGYADIAAAGSRILIIMNGGLAISGTGILSFFLCPSDFANSSFQ